MLSIKLSELLKLLTDGVKDKLDVYTKVQNVEKYENDLTYKEQKRLMQCFKEDLKDGSEEDKKMVLQTWKLCSKYGKSFGNGLIIELCSGVWPKEVVYEVCSTLIADQSLNLEECFKEQTDGVVCNKIIDTLAQISELIPLKALLNFIHITTIGSIFRTNSNFARALLCSFVLKQIPKYGLQECEKEIQRHTVDNFKTVYMLVIEELRKADNRIWYHLCMFSMRYFGKLIHNEIELLNTLLSNIEHGFKTKTIEDKISSFDCWKVLIDISSLDRSYLCSAKQLRLLIKPLKVKLSRNDQVTSKRLEVWIHLLSALQENCLACLEEFMNFCFDPQMPFIRNTWSTRTEVLMNIIGHYKSGECCVHPQSFQLVNPVVNSTNILKYKPLVLNAITICSENMLIWEVKSRRENKIKCLWGSLFRIVGKLYELDKELMLHDIFVILKRFLNKCDEDGLQDYFDDILHPIFNVISTLDDLRCDYLVFNEIIVFPMAQLMLSCPNVPEYRALAFIQLLRSCSKTGSRLDYFNRSCELLKSYTYNKTQILSSYIWLELANELLHICKSPKDEFEAFKISSRFLMCWICECQIPDNLKKMILDKWSAIVIEIDVICDEFKESLVEHFGKLLKENPAIAANVLEFLPSSVDKITEKTSISYITKTVDTVLECLRNPCLHSDKVVIVLPVLSKLSNNISKGDTNQSEILGLKLFECLEYFLKPHRVYETLKIFKIILPKLSQSLRKRLPPKLRTIINDLITHSDSLVAQDAINLLAELDKQELVKPPKFVKPVVSNRTAKIASLSAGGVPQEKSLNLFAQAVQKSPINVKGSVINSINQRNSRIMKIANAMPSFKKQNNVGSDANSSDFVYIDSEVKFDYNKMSSHQKEVLRKRKEDIPALYQDLSQSQHSNQSRSNESLDFTNTKPNKSFENILSELNKKENTTLDKPLKDPLSLEITGVAEKECKQQEKVSGIEAVTPSKRKSTEMNVKNNLDIDKLKSELLESRKCTKDISKENKKRRYSDSQSLSQTSSLPPTRSSSWEDLNFNVDHHKSFKIVPIDLNEGNGHIKLKIAITNTEKTDKEDTGTCDNKKIDSESSDKRLAQINIEMDNKNNDIDKNENINSYMTRSRRSLLSLPRRGRSTPTNKGVNQSIIKNKNSIQQNNISEGKLTDILQQSAVKQIVSDLSNHTNKQDDVLKETIANEHENMDRNKIIEHEVNVADKEQNINKRTRKVATPQHSVKSNTNKNKVSNVKDKEKNNCSNTNEEINVTAKAQTEEEFQKQQNINELENQKKSKKEIIIGKNKILNNRIETEIIIGIGENEYKNEITDKLKDTNKDNNSNKYAKNIIINQKTITNQRDTNKSTLIENQEHADIKEINELDNQENIDEQNIIEEKISNDEKITELTDCGNPLKRNREEVIVCYASKELENQKNSDVQKSIEEEVHNDVKKITVTKFVDPTEHLDGYIKQRYKDIIVNPRNFNKKVSSNQTDTVQQKSVEKEISNNDKNIIDNTLTDSGEMFKEKNNKIGETNGNDCGNKSNIKDGNEEKQTVTKNKNERTRNTRRRTCLGTSRKARNRRKNRIDKQATIKKPEIIQLSQESLLCSSAHTFDTENLMKPTDNQQRTDQLNSDLDITSCTIDATQSQNQNSPKSKADPPSKNRLRTRSAFNIQISMLKMDIVGANQFVGIRRKRATPLRLKDAFKTVADNKRKRESEPIQEKTKRRQRVKTNAQTDKDTAEVAKEELEMSNRQHVETEDEPSQCLVTGYSKIIGDKEKIHQTEVSENLDGNEGFPKSSDYKTKTDVSELKADEFEMKMNNRHFTVALAENPKEHLNNCIDIICLDSQNELNDKSVIAQKENMQKGNNAEDIKTKFNDPIKSNKIINKEVTTFVSIEKINEELGKLSQLLSSAEIRDGKLRAAITSPLQEQIQDTELNVSSENTSILNAILTRSNEKETLLKNKPRRPRKINLKETVRQDLSPNNEIDLTEDEYLINISDDDIIESSQPADVSTLRLSKTALKISETKIVTTSTCQNDSSNINKETNSITSINTPQQSERSATEITSKQIDDTLTCETDASILSIEQISPKDILEEPGTRKLGDTLSCNPEGSVSSIEQVSPECVRQNLTTNLVDLDLDDLPTGLNTVDHENLPGSPISDDTTDRNSELLNNTLDISPIRNDLTQEHTTQEEQLVTPTSFIKNPSSRSMMLMNLLPQGIKLNMSPRMVAKRTPSNVVGSPSTDRVRKMMMNCNGKNTIDGVHVRNEDVDKINVLEFKKEVPSPFATPNRSILKRKAHEVLEYGMSPCAKRKRVNFSDPPITAEKIYFKDQEEDPVETTASLSELNQRKSVPIYPPLINCLASIRDIFTDLNQGDLHKNFSLVNIKTVGDLAKLNSTKVNQLEFLNNPRLSTITTALSAFAERYNAKEKLDEQESSFVPTDVANLPINGETENALLVSALDKLKKSDAGVFELWQELKSLCTRHQLWLISEDLKEFFANQ